MYSSIASISHRLVYRSPVWGQRLIGIPGALLRHKQPHHPSVALVLFVVVVVTRDVLVWP